MTLLENGNVNFFVDPWVLTEATAKCLQSKPIKHSCRSVQAFAFIQPFIFFDSGGQKNTMKLTLREMKLTLPETNSQFAPQNKVFQKKWIVFQPSIFRCEKCFSGKLTSYSAKGPQNKSLNLIFPTKYVIPKSLKVSHWLSQILFRSHRQMWPRSHLAPSTSPRTVNTWSR